MARNILLVYCELEKKSQPFIVTNKCMHTQ